MSRVVSKSIRRVGIPLLLLLSVFMVGCHSRNPAGTALSKPGDILSPGDRARLVTISTGIDRQQAMSDDDLDFWIALLHRGPVKASPSARGRFYVEMMGDVVGRKRLSASGQRKMYDAVLPFVSDPAYITAMDPAMSASDAQVGPDDPSTQKNLRTGDEKIAIKLLAQTRDRRALVALKDLAQNSPNPALRRTAQEYYGKLAAVLD